MPRRSNMLIWIRLMAVMLLLLGGVAICAAPAMSPSRAISTVGTPDPSHRHTFENFPLNVRVFRWVNSRHTPAFDGIFLWYSYLGRGWVLIPIVIAVAIWRRRLLSPLLIAVAIESVVVLVLKGTIEAPRPALVLDHVHLLIDLQHHSFPSGDTAMAFAIAATLQHGERWWGRVAWLAYAALIGYERMYVGVHFPLDVLTGTVIGIGSAALALWIMRKRLHPEEPVAE